VNLTPMIFDVVTRRLPNNQAAIADRARGPAAALGAAEGNAAKLPGTAGRVNALVADVTRDEGVIAEHQRGAAAGESDVADLLRDGLHQNPGRFTLAGQVAAGSRHLVRRLGPWRRRPRGR